MKRLLKPILAVVALTLIFIVDDLLFLALARRLTGWHGPIWLVALIGSVVLSLNVLGAILVFRFLRKKPVTGMEGMIGMEAVTLEPITPNGQGQVRVRGEIWRAESDQAIAAGQRVVITAVQGLTLHVVPADSQDRPGGWKGGSGQE